MINESSYRWARLFILCCLCFCTNGHSSYYVNNPYSEHRILSQPSGFYDEHSFHLHNHQTFAPNIWNLYKFNTHRNYPPIFFEDNETKYYSQNDQMDIEIYDKKLITRNTTNPTIEALSSPILPNCGLNDINSPSKFPWLVLISYKNKTNNRNAYRCFGSIISDLHVITAAHCVQNLSNNLELSHVRVGNLEFRNKCKRRKRRRCRQSQNLRIQSVIVHPQFNKPIYAYDIAVLTLYKPRTNKVNLIPICLPERSVISNVNALLNIRGIVPSWQRVGVNISHKLQYLSMAIKNNTECAIVYSQYSQSSNQAIVITPGELCAQVEFNKNDVCGGDSGGPLMVDSSSLNANKKYTLLGITAFGPTRCDQPNLPSVYTRVGAFIDWIQLNIR